MRPAATPPRAAARPLRGLVHPFAGHPAGGPAAEPIARAIWDSAGYSDELVAWLWSKYRAHHIAHKDPFLAACGDLQLAWHRACRGELEQVSRLMLNYSLMTPSAFGDGPHRHARAPDAPSSLHFVQMDLARTALRAATWSGDEALATEAWDTYEDALADAELTRDEPWFLDATQRAAARFGWDGPPFAADQPRWIAAMATLEHPRAALHRQLVDAVLSDAHGGHDPAPWLRAAELAVELGAGPEWEADALLGAFHAQPDEALRHRMNQLIRAKGVQVFAASLRTLAP